MPAAQVSPYPHIEKLEGQPARLRSIGSVRVAQLVMDDLAHGYSVEEMCRQYPHLQPAQAHAAMAYYFDHQEEIHREIQAELKEADENLATAPPSPFLQRMRAEGKL